MNVYMCSSVSQRVLCFFASSVPFAPDWPLTVHRFKLKNKPTGSWPYEPLKRKSNGPVVLFTIRKDPTHVIFICICICICIYIYTSFVIPRFMSTGFISEPGSKIWKHIKIYIKISKHIKTYKQIIKNKK